MTSQSNFFLFIWFYLGWFGCVYFAKWDLSIWSYVFPLIPVVFILKFNFLTKQKIMFLGLVSLVGTLFDLAIYRAGFIEFPNHSTFFVPHWLVSMWLLFASAFPISQNFLKQRLWLAALLGAVFGPLSYYSGQTLQVLAFKGQLAIPIYALFWGLLFPFAISKYQELK